MVTNADRLKPVVPTALMDSYGRPLLGSVSLPSIGLPPVPLLAGRPYFWPLCPASRHQRRRDTSCPAFWWYLVQVVVH